MPSASTEDYMKVIYLLDSEEDRATTNRIAQRLGVRMASVTGMVKHLAAEGYVRHLPYRGVTLTEKGRAVAMSTLRKHRLIELFLVRTLGLSWDELHADAERLEHAVSDRLVERIDERLGRPRFDPHGAPIPAPDGSMPPPRGITLDQAPVGRDVRVLEVPDRDPRLLRQLHRMHVRVGAALSVVGRGASNGAVTLKVRRRKVVLRREIARQVRVVLAHAPKRR